VALLGSAILTGPKGGMALQRYLRGGAAWMVQDADGLGRTVEAMLSPDRAATMAHAAWALVTAEADIANRVAALLAQALRGKG
jgi:3-deoxy-D-manno-octulosonic-acid transferase